MGNIKKSPFDIIKRPLITEKSAYAGSMDNCVVFEVHPRANKIEIREAVERAFDVKVAKVRTSNVLGKVKRVRSNVGRQVAWKKALVTLEPGNSINVIEGL